MSENFSDALAHEFYKSFKSSLETISNENEHQKRLSKEEIDRMKEKRFINQDRMVVDTSMSRLRKLPSHLVQCYLTLIHMNMRSYKNKLLRILNFYRSIQKRICVEL